MYTFLATILILLSYSGCGAKNTSCTHQTAQSTDTLTTLKLPSIPIMLSTPELRAAYLAEHYWDHVNWADTNYIHHPEIIEQGWVNFIDLLKLVPAEEATKALQEVFHAAEKEKKCYQYLHNLAEKYLYDPNSPLRNEEYYIAVLDAQLASPILSEIEKIRPKERRILAQRNRLGTQAIDFTYTLLSGTEGRLHNLQAEYTLLFFNNPGCHACGEVMDALKTSKIIQTAIQQKRIKILSVYPDENVKEWKSFAADYPKNWLNSYDRKQVIQKNNLYDLKAIPTLYLLNHSKLVLLKDTTPREIEQMLRR